MKKTRYLTATVKKGNRLEINLPELEEGQDVEIILIVPNNQSLVDDNVDDNSYLCESTNLKQNIMKKSLLERRQLLEEQAEEMGKHYEQDQSWQEWVNVDLGEIHEY